MNDDHEGDEPTEEAVDEAAHPRPPVRIHKEVHALRVAERGVVDDAQHDVDEHEQPEEGAAEHDLTHGAVPRHQVEQRLVGVVQDGHWRDLGAERDKNMGKDT